MDHVAGSGSAVKAPLRNVALQARGLLASAARKSWCASEPPECRLVRRSISSICNYIPLEWVPHPYFGRAVALGDSGGRGAKAQARAWPILQHDLRNPAYSFVRGKPAISTPSWHAHEALSQLHGAWNLAWRPKFRTQSLTDAIRHRARRHLACSCGQVEVLSGIGRDAGLGCCSRKGSLTTARDCRKP